MLNPNPTNIRHLLAERHRSPEPCEARAVATTEQRARRQEPIDPVTLAHMLQQRMAEGPTSIVIGVGYGVNEVTFAVLQQLSELLHAELIGTRPAVDAGLVPHERMVGQTGISIAPTFYLAFGISGQRLHTVGIERSEQIVAVNTDREAALFRMADYQICDDALHVALQLVQTLKQAAL